MTEKLINSKPNGVVALILIELALVLGIFYICNRCWFRKYFWNYYRSFINLNFSSSSCWFKSCQTSGSSGFDPLLVIIQVPSKNLVFTLSILLA